VWLALTLGAPLIVSQSDSENMRTVYEKLHQAFSSIIEESLPLALACNFYSQERRIKDEQKMIPNNIAAPLMREEITSPVESTSALCWNDAICLLATTAQPGAPRFCDMATCIRDAEALAANTPWHHNTIVKHVAQRPATAARRCFDSRLEHGQQMLMAARHGFQPGVSGNVAAALLANTIVLDIYGKWSTATIETAQQIYKWNRNMAALAMRPRPLQLQEIAKFEEYVKKVDSMSYKKHCRRLQMDVYKEDLGPYMPVPHWMAFDVEGGDENTPGKIKMKLVIHNDTLYSTEENCKPTSVAWLHAALQAEVLDTIYLDMNRLVSTEHSEQPTPCEMYSPYVLVQRTLALFHQLGIPETLIRTKYLPRVGEWDFRVNRRLHFHELPTSVFEPNCEEPYVPNAIELLNVSDWHDRMRRVSKTNLRLGEKYRRALLCYDTPQWPRDLTQLPFCLENGRKARNTIKHASPTPVEVCMPEQVLNSMPPLNSNANYLQRRKIMMDYLKATLPSHHVEEIEHNLELIKRMQWVGRQDVWEEQLWSAIQGSVHGRILAPTPQEHFNLFPRSSTKRERTTGSDSEQHYEDGETNIHYDLLDPTFPPFAHIPNAIPFLIHPNAWSFQIYKFEETDETGSKKIYYKFKPVLLYAVHATMMHEGLASFDLPLYLDALNAHGLLHKIEVWGNAATYRIPSLNQTFPFTNWQLRIFSEKASEIKYTTSSRLASMYPKGSRISVEETVLCRHSTLDNTTVGRPADRLSSFYHPQAVDELGLSAYAFENLQPVCGPPIPRALYQVAKQALKTDIVKSLEHAVNTYTIGSRPNLPHLPTVQRMLQREEAAQEAEGQAPYFVANLYSTMTNVGNSLVMLNELNMHLGVHSQRYKRRMRYNDNTLPRSYGKVGAGDDDGLREDIRDLSRQIHEYDEYTRRHEYQGGTVSDGLSEFIHDEMQVASMAICEDMPNMTSEEHQRIGLQTLIPEGNSTNYEAAPEVIISHMCKATKIPACERLYPVYHEMM
jgi:hypothetical protein